MIFLICGKAKSGKNTFGSYLREELETNKKAVCTIGFMRTIKGYAKDYFGWDGSESTKPRDFLQQFATETIREKMNMSFFHIDHLTDDIKVLSNYFDTFIVDDTRLPLEIDEIRKRFGRNNVFVIKINRFNYDDMMTDEERSHITEKALDNYQDYDKIINNTSLEELKENAKKIVSEVVNNEIHD